MALVIPTASSTYGDSTVTEGGGLNGKYVLAQLRSTANLEWVREVRSRLVREELKYRDFLEARPRLKKDRDLWSRIENGVGQASVIVIDPEPANLGFICEAFEGGMSLLEIENTPSVFERAEMALIEGTPIAYLPFELATAVPWASYDLISNLERFTPQSINESIGGGLRNARIFAARAHALFDLAQTDSSAVRTDEVFKSPLRRIMLAELISTNRAFDQEEPKTLDVLNEATDEIASAMRNCLLGELTTSDSPLVREIDSRAVDEIQAADIAAGWAREMLDLGEPRILASRLERVWLNGCRIR